MKKRVLVFPCGSEIGLEVYNSVNKSLHFELIGLSSVPDHGKFVYENYIEGIGLFTEPNFIDELNSIIKKYKIDIIYPTMDSVISFLKLNIDNLKIPVVGPSAEVAKLCENKKETYSFLSEHIRVPKIFDKNDNLKFPLFVKPVVGYGSRNSFKVENYHQIENLNLDENVLCEYLPGKEFTVDCFTGLDRKLLFVGARERIRTSNGISVNTKSDESLTKQFQPIADAINEHVDFIGAWFFQLKYTEDGTPCLLEIACRFAGSSSVYRVKGINFALTNLYLNFGIDPFFLINDFEIELDRALCNRFKLNIFYDTVFIDYDDTVVINGKVNLEAIQFIFQCINNNIDVVLITKHKGDIIESLKLFKLTNLFTTILHLAHDEEKSYFIKQSKRQNIIFIDDSFAERRKVYDELQIPVFSVDSINSLIR